MESFFFSGSSVAKLDEKNRFVLKQDFRYGLVEAGKLEFTIALGFSGGLIIYRNSEMEKIVKKFRKNMHKIEFQQFFTLFFSTLYPTSCDKLGRVNIPPLLKQAAKIQKEIVIAGVLDRIEIWPKGIYDENLQKLTSGSNEVQSVMNKAFSLLDEDPVDVEKAVEKAQKNTFEHSNELL